MFLDTHIVSYAKKGRLQETIKGSDISSIVASELLLAYDTRRTAARYYVPIVPTIHLGTSGLGSRKRDHPFSKRVTDQIVFSFGNDFEPFIEFGSMAISTVVNERNAELLDQSIAFLPKDKRKIIREDFDFLIQNDIRCVPLTKPVVDLGYKYLQDFVASGESIKTTLRNTWNDLLILSSACINEDVLWTEDTQLKRFAGSRFGSWRPSEPGTLRIRLNPVSLPVDAKPGSESKGYLNSGWRANFSTGRKQAW